MAKLRIRVKPSNNVTRPKSKPRKRTTPSAVPPGVIQLYDPCNAPAVATAGYSGFGTIRQRNIVTLGAVAGQTCFALLYHPCIGIISCASDATTSKTFDTVNLNSVGGWAASTSPGACLKLLPNTSMFNTSGNVYSTIVDGDWVYQNLLSTRGGPIASPSYPISAFAQLCTFSTKMSYEKPLEFKWTPGPRDEIPIDSGYSSAFQVQQIIDGWSGRNFLLVVVTGLYSPPVTTPPTPTPGVNVETVSLNTYVENPDAVNDGASAQVISAGIINTVARSKPMLLKAAEWLSSRNPKWWLDAAHKASSFASYLAPAMSALAI